MKANQVKHVVLCSMLLLCTLTQHSDSQVIKEKAPSGPINQTGEGLVPAEPVPPFISFLFTMMWLLALVAGAIMGVGVATYLASPAGGLLFDLGSLNTSICNWFTDYTDVK